MKRKTTREPIQNEADNELRNARHTVAMSRGTDPHSATAGFFINLADNDFINHSAKNEMGWGYAVFEEVVDGAGVLQSIADVRTGTTDGHENFPVEEVIIQKAVIEG